MTLSALITITLGLIALAGITAITGAMLALKY